jgi:predicted nucleic acid-binding protein
MVIATAIRAQAGYIVTRDDDLLSLQTYESITIVTPEAFMAISGTAVVAETKRLHHSAFPISPSV